MESAQTTPVRVAGGPQERQLIAGRYRLASFHRGDEDTEVWRALDESSNKVVSVEFLRERSPGSRERFVAAGRRMASAVEPSVMRVAAVHDDADGTFIVFEHLVNIPVPLDWVKVEAPAPIPGTETPGRTEIVADVSAMPTPQPVAETENATAEVATERPTDRGLSLLLFALRKREFSLIDTALLTESVIELANLSLSELEAVRIHPDFIADLRSLPRHLSPSSLVSALAGIAAVPGRVATIRPHVRFPTPHISRPQSRPRPAKPARMKAAAPAKQSVLRAAAVPRAPRVSRGLGLRVRWGRVLTRGLSLGLLAAILIALPSELIGNMGNIANDLSAQIRDRLAAMQQTTPSLQRASFEVPPLSAYGAAFEAQAPYPTARPNATVEWVVALRNTGSAGWYRGIDGAQASLALPDGTIAGVQTTAYVGPGQVGWFVVHFPAPSQPGVSKITLRPRIDGRGALPDLGIYVTVTVSPNP